jgi:hypothetical protein
MGYRSDVAIAVYGPEEVVAPFVTANRLLGDIDFGDVDIYQYTDGSVDKMCMVMVNFEDVKWYDSYKEVQEWEDFMKRAGRLAATEPLNAEFVRVGEEAGDIEQIAYGESVQHYLGYVSRITIDLPEEEAS